MVDPLLKAGTQAAMVIATWSFLYKENIFSRTAATIIISVSSFHHFMRNMERAWDFGVVPIWEDGKVLNILPIFLGLLLYTRLSKQYSWLASYSFSVTLGLGTGATLTTLFSRNVLGLVADTVEAPFGHTDMLETVSGLILFAGAILALTYWIFTKEATGLFGYAVRIGRLFLMISIGYLYAEDVVWSQSLFVGAWEMVNGFIRLLLGIS
jgi:hypothetical protein